LNHPHMSTESGETEAPTSRPRDAGGLGGPFRLLATSSGLSNLADGVFKLSLPLIAIDFTRSPAVVAGLESVRTLPWLLFALPIGALADRFDRRRVMVLANLARAALVLVGALMLVADQGSIWLLYVIAAGTGTPCSCCPPVHGPIVGTAVGCWSPRRWRVPS
jgi:MFS family permease